jgi:ribosomal protein L17
LNLFEATGLWPANRSAVLKRFNNEASDEDEIIETTSALQANDRRQLERLVRAAVKDTSAEESKRLAELLHHFQVENELLHDGLKVAPTSIRSTASAVSLPVCSSARDIIVALHSGHLARSERRRRDAL